jgi:hypothetical protein
VAHQNLPSRTEIGGLGVPNFNFVLLLTGLSKIVLEFSVEIPLGVTANARFMSLSSFSSQQRCCARNLLHHHPKWLLVENKLARGQMNLMGWTENLVSVKHHDDEH